MKLDTNHHNVRSVKKDTKRTTALGIFFYGTDVISLIILKYSLFFLS